MKAYQVTLLVIDHDHVGADGIIEVLENQRYPNRCISPEVKRTVEVDIGEWTDDHPLNRRDTAEAYYHEHFDN
jgi:hypothetical protein